jgi:hypothetical protein
MKLDCKIRIVPLIKLCSDIFLQSVLVLNLVIKKTYHCDNLKVVSVHRFELQTVVFVAILWWFWDSCRIGVQFVEVSPFS